MAQVSEMLVELNQIRMEFGEQLMPLAVAKANRSAFCSAVAAHGGFLSPWEVAPKPNVYTREGQAVWRRANNTPDL